MEDRQVRQITDSRVLAALSHPLRRRLMDVMKVYGPSTASMLAERTGQAVANVSHHLKVLAGCELVVEAPELARDRRERWWRLGQPGLSWNNRDFDGDPVSHAVAEAARSINLDRHIGMVRAWYGAGEAEQVAWGNSTFSTDQWLRLTPEELTELNREVIDLLDRWKRRDIPDDGRTREPVFVFAYGVPAKP
ncbi:ArsR/SmtB family transcription factor [Plantactinospora sp. GCM10030261]|uniref:ArsR/SmtB family transcription factor n=1 Tax=Plantactinospora sp. GCM10030261 TaxID=3273420 RepID=UPI0036241E07